MMTFTLEEVFSSVYRAADTLPIGSLSKSAHFGEHKSQFKGDGHDFDRIVEYDPAVHSISQIDWRSMTRDKVYVREFNVTKDFDVRVVIDLSTSMTFGTDQQHKERMLHEILLSIGLACSHAMDPMGLIGFAEDIIFDEEPRVGENQAHYLTSQLYDFFDGLQSDGRGKLDRKKTDFYNVFDFIQRTHTYKTSFLIVISDFIGIEDFQNIEVLNDITSQHEAAFIFLDDPLEFNIDGLGYIKQEDMETGRTYSVSRSKSRKLGLEIRKKRKQFRKKIQEAGIDSIVLEYGKHLQRLFRFFIIRHELLRS